MTAYDDFYLAEPDDEEWLDEQTARELLDQDPDDFVSPHRRGIYQERQTRALIRLCDREAVDLA